MNNKLIRLGDFYCILVDLYCGDMDGNEWTELHYVAVEHKTGKDYIVYRETLDSDTRLFDNWDDANAYLVRNDYFRENCANAWVCSFDDAVEAALANAE